MLSILSALRATLYAFKGIENTGLATSSSVAKHDKSSGFMDLPHGTRWYVGHMVFFNRLSARSAITIAAVKELSSSLHNAHGPRDWARCVGESRNRLKR